MQEIFGVKEHALLDVWQSVNAGGQILGHFTGFDGVNACLLQRQSKTSQFRCVIELGTVFKTACPCIDRCDRIGGG